MPGANYFKTEMDITYREIQELNEQLADLKEQERILWGYVQSSGKAVGRLLKQSSNMLPDNPALQEVKRAASSFSYQHTEVQRKIQDLKSQKNDLWDQHNKAKAEWRRLRGSRQHTPAS